MGNFQDMLSTRMCTLHTKFIGFRLNYFRRLYTIRNWKRISDIWAFLVRCTTPERTININAFFQNHAPRYQTWKHCLHQAPCKTCLYRLWIFIDYRRRLGFQDFNYFQRNTLLLLSLDVCDNDRGWSIYWPLLQRYLLFKTDDKPGKENGLLKRVSIITKYELSFRDKGKYKFNNIKLYHFCFPILLSLI